MADWQTFEQGIKKEWLLTNGIGGFASSTIIGANTRRYHGLLVASLKSPVQRHLILSKLDECIEIEGKCHNIYSFKTPEYIMKGYYYLQRAKIDPLPAFLYRVEDVFLEKKICMVYGKNTVCILYHIMNGASRVRLKLAPLVNFRDYHHTSHRYHMKFDCKPCSKGVLITPYNLDLGINIYCSEGEFTAQEDCWFFNMEYPVEHERGLDSLEDHFIPGYFAVDVNPWEDRYITVLATVENDAGTLDGIAIHRQEEERMKLLVEEAGYQDEFAACLVRAADNFIVYRKSTDAKTIIAGYPWFTDWGRDTMIAFTGLTLVTKRFDDARQILYTFSRYVKHGLVPNMFPDEGQEPAYNSVDAALWYFEAVYKFVKYTGDYKFVYENIYDVLREIIDSYISGTRFSIKMDDDYLITAGNKSTQLTWMDAKIGDWIVTPRHGKAVEINALWYNSLKVMAHLASGLGEDNSRFEQISERLKETFLINFWNEERQCLYDVLNEEIIDDSIRPNQILAVSLSNPILEGDIAKKVVQKVWKELYTPYGLRSLSRQSDQYCGVYTGNQYKRDGAYHQGTVWTWPLGHFVTAFMKVYGYSLQNRKKAYLFIEPFIDHLKDACVGSISEIFDGNEPHTPRGCFAQAWSVGEILRTYVEDLKM